MKYRGESILNCVIIVMILVIIAALVTGCTSTLGNIGIAGKYFYEKNTDQYIELNQDGTFYQTTWSGGFEGTYKVVNNKVRLCTTQGGCNEFTISNDELIGQSGLRFKKDGLTSSSTVLTTVQTIVQRTYVVGATALKSGSDIWVTYYGGPDEDYLTRFDVTVVTSDGKSHQSFVDAPPVGYKFTFPGLATSGKNHIICTGTFADGVQKTIFDSYL